MAIPKLQSTAGALPPAVNPKPGKEGKMKPTDLPPRIASKIKVNPESGCWEWQGAKHSCGYGRITTGGSRSPNMKVHYPHRIAYESVKGPIPQGLQIDHLCRNRLCVNPDYLEAVTQKENMLRGIGASAINAAKTHCIRGHVLEGDNLQIPRGGKWTWRRCHECYKLRKRKAWKDAKNSNRMD